ncbi:MAG: hypothetical protein KJ077_10800 [Anaerolineae bacterium]|nr:hypothetical protein [Anaerolineae bacterium]
MAKCQHCKTNHATWAEQQMEQGTRTYTLLGSHYRGFKVTKVCDACKEASQNYPTLSPLAARLYEIMIARYIEHGYMYSGCLHPNGGVLFQALKINPPDRVYKLIEELLACGKVQVRQCQAYAIELPAAKRVELIQEHQLDRVWEENAPYFYPNGSGGEVTSVRNAP